MTDSDFVFDFDAEWNEQQSHVGVNVTPVTTSRGCFLMEWCRELTGFTTGFIVTKLKLIFLTRLKVAEIELCCNYVHA